MLEIRPSNFCRAEVAVRGLSHTSFDEYKGFPGPSGLAPSFSCRECGISSPCSCRSGDLTLFAPPHLRGHEVLFT